MSDLYDLRNALDEQAIELAHIVVLDRRMCIGQSGEFSWFIPEAVQHIKALTSGGVVLMGRKTFEAIGQPLNHRTNWVVTRNERWHFDHINFSHSLEDALWFASEDAQHAQQNNTVFILGGADIFTQTIDIIDRLEIIWLDADIKGDLFYPSIPEQLRLSHQQRGINQTHNISYRFETYHFFDDNYQ